jgi:hypothetical protein
MLTMSAVPVERNGERDEPKAQVISCEEFSDVTLVVEGVEMRAHRFVLMIHSDYFRCVQSCPISRPG